MASESIVWHIIREINNKVRAAANVKKDATNRYFVDLLDAVPHSFRPPRVFLCQLFDVRPFRG